MNLCIWNVTVSVRLNDENEKEADFCGLNFQISACATSFIGLHGLHAEKKYTSAAPAT